jgi:hypothetical protein
MPASSSERGDRLPLRHRWVRRVVAEQPELFRMEFAPEPVDLEWVASIEDDAEERYRAVLAAREAEKARQERARRDELKAQDAPQPDLEGRFKKQEAERKKKEEQAREDVERERLEQRVELTGGFHY